MERFVESGIDFEHANAARMYDYYLGGAHHFAVDRETADRAIARYPRVRYGARANRSFLGRVVQWCLAEGIDQFVDLGSGVPTVGNVHEVAHRTDPAARVAYVDFEPVAVAHARQLLADLADPTVTVTRADVRDPDAVLGAPGVAGLVDLGRPVALLAVAVLHFVPGDLRPLLDRYVEHLAPGSAVAVSHTGDDHPDPEITGGHRATRDAYRDSATPLVLRSREDIVAATGALDPVPPGVVDIVDWPENRPDTADTGVHAAVGRVPTP